MLVSDASLLRNGGSDLSLKDRSGCLSNCILAFIRVLSVFNFYCHFLVVP